jgi:hypothetical protein
VDLFHYHLVTSRVREVEARYVGKLGFGLVARHGRIGEDYQSVEPGVSWEELDRLGFRLRLSELERGSVNVVVQPGQWDLPRVDHVGLALAEEEFEEVVERATAKELRIQSHGGRRTFVATNAGYRLEIHPLSEWLEELLAARSTYALTGLHLLSEDPEAKAAVLADLLGLDRDAGDVQVGATLVRFLPDGPPGRPQLQAELFT